MRRALALTAVLVAGAGAGAASCSGGSSSVAVPSSTTAASTTAAATTTAAPTSTASATTGAAVTTAVPTPAPTWPLTGRPADPASPNYKRPALAVKINNEAPARPQSGLNAADVVIEEIVESDTRYVAVFHSSDAEPIGPVRSARTSDIAILGALGKPLFAWSGGNPGVRSAVGRANLTDVGFENQPSAGYYRARDRVAPHNLYTTTARLYEAGAELGATEGPPPGLLTYRPAGAAALTAGVAVQEVSWAMEGNRQLWEWVPAFKIFGHSVNGRVHTDKETGDRVYTQNVVILETEYGASPADPRSPEAQTVGMGAATVLTDGRAVEGRWERADIRAPFTVVDAAGAPILLTPGRTWIELVRPGTEISQS